MPLSVRSAATAAAMVALAVTLHAQDPQITDRTFHWSGAVASGHWLRVRNLSGPIHVERGTSNQVEVDAEKRGHGDVGDIHFELRRTGADNGDVIICALWDKDATCDWDDVHEHVHHHHWHDDDDDLAVHFTVRLPAGVNIGATTVNGDVSVDGATAEVRARTVNGTVNASTVGGPVDASTVNGDVEVHMATTGQAHDLNYSTVNGSVIVTFPTKLDADIDLSTVNGNVASDFPVTLEGHIDPKHLHGTIGAGGLHIHASTVNGEIELRKA
jgi:hypothetical protein